MPCGHRTPCLEKSEEQRGEAPRPEGSAGAVRAAQAVWACAAAPAHGGRPMFRFAATSVLSEGISGFLRRSVDSTLWETLVEHRQPLLEAWVGRLWLQTAASRRSGGPSPGKERPSLEARADFCSLWTAVSRSSGRPSFTAYSRFSKPGRTSFYRGQPIFNARGNGCLPRDKRFSALWGP